MVSRKLLSVRIVDFCDALELDNYQVFDNQVCSETLVESNVLVFDRCGSLSIGLKTAMPQRMGEHDFVNGPGHGTINNVFPIPFSVTTVIVAILADADIHAIAKALIIQFRLDWVE